MRHSFFVSRPSLLPFPLQSSLVWARMSNVSVEVSPSHTDPYINTRGRKKKQEAAHDSCGWAQPVSQWEHVTFVWQEVGGKWECAHRNATLNGARYLDAFLRDHETFNQSKCWLIEVQTHTSGSIRPSIKHVSSWPLNGCYQVRGDRCLKVRKLNYTICVNWGGYKGLARNCIIKTASQLTKLSKL